MLLFWSCVLTQVSLRRLLSPYFYLLALALNGAQSEWKTVLILAALPRTVPADGNGADMDSGGL